MERETERTDTQRELTLPGHTLNDLLFPSSLHFLKSLLPLNNPLTFEPINKLIHGWGWSPIIQFQPKATTLIVAASTGPAPSTHEGYFRCKPHQALTLRRLYHQKTSTWVDFNHSSGSTLSSTSMCSEQEGESVSYISHWRGQKHSRTRLNIQLLGTCTATVVHPLSSPSPRAIVCTLKIHILLPKSLLLKFFLLSVAGSAVIRDSRPTFFNTIVKFSLTFP